MNDFADVPFSYLVVTLIIIGFISFAFLRMLYIYLVIKIKALLALFLMTLAALFYVTFDISALLFAFYNMDIVYINSCLLFREFSTVLFCISIPPFLSEVVQLDSKMRRINHLVTITVAVTSVLVTALAIMDPSLLLGDRLDSVSDNIRQAVAIRTLSPLFIVKNLVVFAVMVYAVFVLASFFKKTKYHIAKNIASFVALLYFVLSGFFVFYFHNAEAGFVNYYYPHLSVGIAVFVLLNSFGLVDIYADNRNSLVTTKKYLVQNRFVDSKLDILNRDCFIDELNRVQDKFWQSGSEKEFSLLFIDIDEFQNINESFGENIGDGILKGLSQRIAGYFGTDGILYRIGGDDFVFWCHDHVSEESSIKLAQNIVTSLRNPFMVSGTPYYISTSLGIMRVPRDGDEVEMIFYNAYNVMRSAKKIKNTWKVFTSEINETISSKIETINMLRESISQDQFELYYQPVYNMENQIVYAEALLRCTRSEKSISSPGVFIPLIEKAGFMKDIDDMVVRKYFNAMESKIRKRIPLSINLSSHQLIDPEYCDFLYQFAVQHSVDPHLVILEIVENTLIENLAAGSENLTRLKNYGFKIAIDDFGKGFSSLSYLSELPIDTLKVDMAFVQSVPGKVNDEAIAKHIVALAKSLDLKVVAEGFETPEQVEFFQKIGCDYYQGYYFSRPVPIDKLLTML